MGLVKNIIDVIIVNINFNCSFVIIFQSVLKVFIYLCGQTFNINFLFRVILDYFLKSLSFTLKLFLSKDLFIKSIFYVFFHCFGDLILTLVY